MRFKHKHRILVRLFLMAVCGLLCVSSPVLARVNRHIQKGFESLYEDKIFFLRTDLSLFGEKPRYPEFITDTQDFLYPSAEEDEQKTVVFEKGEKVLIDEVDFDKDEIIITFISVDSEEEGELVFQFKDRLSPAFNEKAAFTRRYEEIFLPEKLKKTPFLTDKVSNLIDAGEIYIGMDQDDLFLTLGRASDIVKRVRPDGVTQAWYYRENRAVYEFFFENDELREWSTYQK